MTAALKLFFGWFWRTFVPRAFVFSNRAEGFSSSPWWWSMDTLISVVDMRVRYHHVFVVSDVHGSI